MRNDDDEFTREPLPATSSADAVQGIHGGWFALPRTLLVTGIGLLLVAVLLVGSGTTGALWQQARFAWLQRTAPTLTASTIHPRPATQRALPGNWERQPDFPLPSPDVSGYYQLPNDPTTFYTCSAQHITASGQQQVGPLIFWQSHDSGQRWSSARLPETKDTFCDVTSAANAPQRLLMRGQLYSGCANVDAFLSSDGGTNWYAIATLPTAPVSDDPTNGCAVSLWPTAHHLYLSYWYVTTAGPPQHPAPTQHSTLWRSDDNGKTWQNLDAYLPPGVTESSPTGSASGVAALGDGETLVLKVYQFDPHDPAEHAVHTKSLFWLSYDAGESWQPWGVVDGLAVGQLLPGAGEMSPSPAHPVYLINSAAISSRLLRIQIAQATDMRRWSSLPPLPIPGASPAHLGITSVLTETPSGRLLVFGLGPDDHIAASDAELGAAPRPARQWLWQWDPRASQWTLLTPVLAAPWPGQCSDHCWNGWLTSTAHGARVYLVVTGYAFDGQQFQTTTYRVPLPDSL